MLAYPLQALQREPLAAAIPLPSNDMMARRHIAYLSYLYPFECFSRVLVT